MQSLGVPHSHIMANHWYPVIASSNVQYDLIESEESILCLQKLPLVSVKLRKNNIKKRKKMLKSVILVIVRYFKRSHSFHCCRVITGSLMRLY